MPDLDAGKRHVSLDTVGIDVLSVIASHLGIQSVARLEQTCKILRAFVIGHAWPLVAARYSCKRRGQDESQRGKIGDVKDAVRIDVAWARRTFDVTESEIGLRNGGGPRISVPFSRLLLLPHGLVLVVRSELHYWPNTFLQGRETLSLANSQSFYLFNPANLDRAWQRANLRRGTRRTNGKDDVRPSAMWDICTCATLDQGGRMLALARVNGLVEVITLSVGPEGLRIRLAWFWTELMGNTDIQTMASLTDRGTLAICSKRGQIWLLAISMRRVRLKERLDVRPLHRLHVQGRIWSAAFTDRGDDRALLAIGTKGEQSILLYEVHKSHPNAPKLMLCLSSGTTPAYTLAFDNRPGHLGLFAGCFDGAMRVFDVHEALDRGEVHAKWVHHDLADSSAIYSMVTRTGLGNCQVAVGTARHGVIKIYDPYCDTTCRHFSAEHAEGQGWTIFASYPAHSPTYALVGQHDRLFGATDSKLWQIDLRARRLTDPHETQSGRVAYYRHSKVILETSDRPKIL